MDVYSVISDRSSNVTSLINWLLDSMISFTGIDVGSWMTRKTAREWRCMRLFLLWYVHYFLYLGSNFCAFDISSFLSRYLHGDSFVSNYIVSSCANIFVILHFVILILCYWNFINSEYLIAYQSISRKQCILSNSILKNRCIFYVMSYWNYSK